MEKEILEKRRTEGASKHDEKRTSLAKPSPAGARSRYSIQIHVVTIFAYCLLQYKASFTRRKIIAKRLKAVGSNVSRDTFEPTVKLYVRLI